MNSGIVSAGPSLACGGLICSMVSGASWVGLDLEKGFLTMVQTNRRTATKPPAEPNSTAYVRKNTKTASIITNPLDCPQPHHTRLRRFGKGRADPGWAFATAMSE